jgi:hypothetical protein
MVLHERNAGCQAVDAAKNGAVAGTQERSVAIAGDGGCAASDRGATSGRAERHRGVSVPPGFPGGSFPRVSRASLASRASRAPCGSHCSRVRSSGIYASVCGSGTPHQQPGDNHGKHDYIPDPLVAQAAAGP